MFEGQVDSPKRINPLYDDVEQHYHVIVNITGAMAKNYLCNTQTNLARVKPPTAATIHVAIVWRALVRFLHH